MSIFGILCEKERSCSIAWVLFKFLSKWFTHYPKSWFSGWPIFLRCLVRSIGSSMHRHISLGYKCLNHFSMSWSNGWRWFAQKVLFRGVALSAIRNFRACQYGAVKRYQDNLVPTSMSTQHQSDWRNDIEMTSNVKMASNWNGPTFLQVFNECCLCDHIDLRRMQWRLCFKPSPKSFVSTWSLCRNFAPRIVPTCNLSRELGSCTKLTTISANV